jgi:hypothetical protein
MVDTVVTTAGRIQITWCVFLSITFKDIALNLYFFSQQDGGGNNSREDDKYISDSEESEEDKKRKKPAKGTSIFGFVAPFCFSEVYMMCGTRVYLWCMVMEMEYSVIHLSSHPQIFDSTYVHYANATRNTQHATRNTQHATRNTQHATRNTQHATRNTQHSTLHPQQKHTTLPQLISTMIFTA